jgi:hypothetical protein
MKDSNFRKRMAAKFRNGVDKIMTTWEENPMLVITIVSGLMVASAKVVDTASSVQSRRAYAGRSTEEQEGHWSARSPARTGTRPI